MATKKTKSGANRKAIGTGVVLASTAALAGYYFYASKDAEKHRKKAARWATNLKSEVKKDIKKASSTLNKQKVKKIVNDIAKGYQKAKNVDTKELRGAVKELHENWDKLVKEARGTTKKVVKRAKTTSKKVKSDIKGKSTRKATKKAKSN